MKKKLRIMLCTMIIISLYVSSCFALEVEVSVKINDNYVKSDQKNILIDDTVFVLARFVTEALNGQVTWNEDTKSMIIDYEGKKMKLTAGSDVAYIDSKEYKLESKPFLRGGRMYIPVRFISENLNCDINWVHETFTVDIKKQNLVISEEKFEQRYYTDEEMKLLAKIIQVESGNTNLEGRLGVANVVLNRVKSNRFPNDINSVVYQRGQFPPAHKESFKTLKPNNLSNIAAKKALEGVNNVENCLFFNSRPFKSKKKSLYKIIDGEYFYK
ncbi:stalk domain-containing protein [Tepidibacter hydrothermalis]|uniref:Stalk domain-containing protein n=1 Tax=Tepidibacter hydrothermalis TaxID=3036126 RepID=A0ABY8EBF9_9FIRM|nr:stalk domain-containing protein [Tepidibacter hydrothermalis]WFD08847.1 stalk domain-containing protein [Tepidibacter hydrothermalis]